MRVLVTGGTGFLGRHIVDRLVARGDDVRVLGRTPDPSLPAAIDFVRGSILDEATLLGAMDGCETVFHLAGKVSRGRREVESLRRVHVDGTLAMVEGASTVGVKRVLYASTSGIVGVSRHPRPDLDEHAPYPDALVANWPYYATKLAAERRGRARAIEQNVELVCINPSLLLGPGDTRQSSTGDVRRIVRGELPAIPSGGVNFVDVRDVADAALVACERGVAGERYLLGGVNWSLRRFITEVATLAGVAAPRWRAPRRPTRWLATAVEAVSWRLGLDSPLDPVEAEMSEVYWFFSSDRAIQELGFQPRDPLQTLRDTLDDLG